MASIRRYWRNRHPDFWAHLQRKVAAGTAGRCCRAYHDGFVVPLARDPKAVLLALVGEGSEEVSDDAALAAAVQPCIRGMSA